MSPPTRPPAISSPTAAPPASATASTDFPYPPSPVLCLQVAVGCQSHREARVDDHASSSCPVVRGCAADVAPCVQQPEVRHAHPWHLKRWFRDGGILQLGHVGRGFSR